MKNFIQVAYPFFSKSEINFVKSNVSKVLKGKLSTGPFTKEFENTFAKYVGSKYAVFLNSCTSALEISISYLNLHKTDEVIVPTQSFIADGSSVVTNNGKIIFANINPNTFCLDLKEIKNCTSRNTKAIILVHFGGYMPHDIRAIRSFCKKKNIKIIEDCAHAIGSKIHGYKAGTLGLSGCFSFFSTKTITTAEGGMITTNDKKFYNYALSMRTRGNIENLSIELYDKIGRNCRPSEISALLGIAQMKNIIKINNLRSSVVKIYNNHIKKDKNLDSLEILNNSKLSIWKYIAIIKNSKISRSDLQKVLKNKYKININWAYTPLLHNQPIFKKFLNKKDKTKLKKTEKLCKKHFHLPLHTLITPKKAHYIVKSLKSAINEILSK